MESLIIEKKNVKMIAHRGLSGLEKENTIAAFIAAGNRSYYGCECDIHQTTDKKFVVIHDSTTKRVSPWDINVEEESYDKVNEVCLYDIDSTETKNYLKIPTLEEYILVCKKYQKECIVELKQSFDEIQIREVIKIITDLKYIDRVVFISFFEENLKTVRKISKTIRMQLLVSEFSKHVISFCKKLKIDVDINYQVLTKEIVEKFHENNIKVNCWTVNNPIVALMLVTWDVDYITTNILE